MSVWAPRGASVVERLMLHTDRSGECWIWTGALVNGYGRMTVDGRSRRVHRVAYETLVGPIPEGMSLDHLCRVTQCCNPEHLEPVPQRINLLRGNTLAAQNAAKTTCPRGHSYAEHAWVYQGRRYCRACRRKAATA